MTAEAQPDLGDSAALERATDAAIDAERGAPGKESQATSIVRLAAAAGVELWHTPAGEGYISVPVAHHLEHYPLTGRACRDYLTRLYYRDVRRAPNAAALQDAIATLSGMARFDGPQHEVYVRVAAWESRIYLDLCDPEWRVVQIGEDGWAVVTDPPVRFRRPQGVVALPVPGPHGSIADLHRFLNVENDDDFVLVVTWLLAAFRARGPYPILAVMAEQGAAKTTTTRVLRRLVDPNESDVRRPPRNTEDLMIAATNSHVVAFDNLSRLPDELSDTRRAVRPAWSSSTMPRAPGATAS
jgi:hypothetical protein